MMKEKKVVFRFLNGILHNCEFTLEHQETVFIVGHPDALDKHALGAISLDNVIVVPSYSTNENFRFSLRYRTDDELELKVYHGDKVDTQVVNMNNICSVHDLIFAVRNHDETFSDEILTMGSDSPSSERKSQHTFNKKKPLGIALVTITMLIACAGILIFVFWFNSINHQTREVKSLLEKRIGSYTILHDKQRKTFILTSSVEAANWARQVIARSSLSYDVSVATLNEEQQRLAYWINKNHPEIEFHRINMDNPENPNIELSYERNALSKTDEENFRHQLIQMTPYASGIKLTFIKDGMVSMLAEDALKKSSINFKRIDNPSSVLFLVQGDLHDGALDNIKNIISDFTSVWGGEYIQFAVEMKDDNLNQQSFKYGSHDYIKMSPGHWYFSDKK